ncbi:MAG TPA: alginate export family protein [Candidatus Hydrogenedentes bacterium]|nr:alginate export family protein [Candidatus Hydrogenedentota bacterium]HOS01829.1 alginate export family protein [Candidatus Hydrogenedentota bacterium]
MKRLFVILSVFLVSGSAFAELQNIQVGGQIRIRGRFWSSTFENNLRNPRTIHMPANFLPGRSIGPYGVASQMSWDSHSNDQKYVEQNAKLRVTADYTDNVSAVIEVDWSGRWGNDFRSDYVTGADGRGGAASDVQLLQSYIQTRETFGLPLQVRLGRQQIVLGDGWLVGDSQGIMDISFDGIRLTYDNKTFAVDGWAAKLAEGGTAEQDGDVDFYGIAATCRAVPKNEFTAYWLLVRDARSLRDTQLVWFGEWFENLLGLDDYDVTNLHTVGARAAGAIASADYKVELAYQFGNADRAGSLFKPFTYGDPRASYDAWAGDIEVGYTFDIAWKPRVFAGGAYFDGEDQRDLSFLEWLSPFDRPKASLSFNRLFSSKTYLYVFDQDRNTSNFHDIRAGVSVKPTDSVKVSLAAHKLAANAAFDMPWNVLIGRYRVPLLPGWSFLTTPCGKDIGYVAELNIDYQYSKDLSFKLTWEHLFADRDLNAGNFLYRNGFEFGGGSNSDDADYVAFDTRLKF